MSIRKIFAVIAATAITGVFILGLGEAASSPLRWVPEAVARSAVDSSGDLTEESA
jgi:hypothetical protein